MLFIYYSFIYSYLLVHFFSILFIHYLIYLLFLFIFIYLCTCIPVLWDVTPHGLEYQPKKCSASVFTVLMSVSDYSKDGTTTLFRIVHYITTNSLRVSEWMTQSILNCQSMYSYLANSHMFSSLLRVSPKLGCHLDYIDLYLKR